MKKYLLPVLFFFIMIDKVYASCSLSEENRLQTIASQVKVTYEYNDNAYDDYGEKIKESFSITITGLTEEIYALEESTSSYFLYNKDNNIITKDGFASGSKVIKVYSTKGICPDVLRKIYISLPKYNDYADDPLCQDVDVSKFALCDKWYQFDIDYNTFVKRVTEYKNQLNQPNQDPAQEKENTLHPILLFFQKYIVYIVAGILVLIIGIVLVIRKKRSDPFE